MDTRTLISILVFSVIVLVCSIVFHTYWKYYFQAVILSSFISAILFQVVGYFVMGYLDPFFLIALVPSWVISFVSSLIIGLPFLIIRKKIKRRKDKIIAPEDSVRE